MTVDKAQVIKVISAAIVELNETLEDKKRIIPSDQAVLSGSPSKLTSLDLVNLIVLAEEKISDEFSVSINLADEKAMSQKHSPFRSVDTLANYVVQLLGEKGV